MPRFRVPLALGATLLGLCAMTVAAPLPARAASPAEMRVDAPAAAQAVGAPFEVRVSITRAEAAWAGYSNEIIYDAKVLKVNSVRPGGIADCKDPNTWANPPQDPGTILSACVFQATTDTGVTEIIELECMKDGSSALRFVTVEEDPSNGSRLFDENAANIATDLVDASVTCGAGGPIETLAAPTRPPAPSSVPSGGSTPGVGGTPGGSAQGATQTSDDGSDVSWWLIAVIVVVVLGAGGGAGWFMLQRRRGAGGG